MRTARLSFATAVLATVTVPVAMTSYAATPPAPTPTLTLSSTVRAITVDRYPGEAPALWDIGLRVIAGKHPLEVRTRHLPYDKPVTGTITAGGRTQPLPAGLTNDVNQLSDFYDLSFIDAAGKVISTGKGGFCPNSYDASRARPGVKVKNIYPEMCSAHPYTVGQLLGLQAGWSTPLISGFWMGPPPEATPEADIPDGVYTVKAQIRPAYRKLLSLPVASSTTSVKVTVKTRPMEEDLFKGDFEAMMIDAGPAPLPRPAAAVARAAGRAPTAAQLGQGKTWKGPKPDLESLPAFDIALQTSDENGNPSDKTFLSFSATVWNSGDSPLVLDGFRRRNADIMDAYQYFYDAKGKEVGSRKHGTMEWDPRDGHTHWHFTDFATYQLVDSAKKNPLVSGKEAFCLANTDAVDTTIKGVKLRPDGTDLHTACGGFTSASVREVLYNGWGDTYGQYLPGQSIDVTDVPNGTYYVKVWANPVGQLVEKSTTNNISYRKIILGGKPGGERTLEVPAYQGIKA